MCSRRINWALSSICWWNSDSPMKRSESPACGNVSEHDDRPRALLQVFHQAVKRDMQNMNPDGGRWWFGEKTNFKKGKKERGIALLVWSDNDKTSECDGGAPARGRGLLLNTGCQLAQWMPQPPLPAPSPLPSGHSSGHAHGCYSSAGLNASVPPNKGAERPRWIHSPRPLPKRRPFSGNKTHRNQKQTHFSSPISDTK